MALLFGWWVTDVAVLVSSLLVGLYFYFVHIFSYWEKRGVPCLKPSIPFGNISDTIFLRQQFGILAANFYTRFAGHKFGGVFQINRPTLILRDPEVIRSFLVKDFANFQDRGIYHDEKNDPISGHLFILGGTKWKNLRAKLTPTFTSGKMKMMFDEISKCGQELTECIQTHADDGDVVEIKDLISRYTTDVIATCAFGIQCNCIKNPEAEFRLRGRDFFNPSAIEGIGLLLAILVPSLSAILKTGGVPKRISDFFRNVVKETVEYREKNDVTRKDFMQLLIQLKNKGYVEDDATASHTEKDAHEKTNSTTKLTLDEISAQAFIFFLAGFETSSTTVSFCLHQLAINRDIQTRLRAEVDTVLEKHGGIFTYDAMMEMEYLAMVIDETLRMYPPLPVLNRECNTAFTMADTGLVVEPGTHVIVPVYGLHYDPQYYSEPETFNPERFTREEKAKRINYTFMPFGEGPRACIGARFGYMQTKVALISLISRFEFTLSEKTILNDDFNPKSFTLSTKGGLFLKVLNRA